MLKTFILFLFSGCIIFYAQVKLPRFVVNELNEQIRSFNYDPEIKVLINAPSADEFNKNSPAGLILYALPNGNTTEQTIGKMMNPEDDWHFDIQHIGAQTRFLRNNLKDYNLITVYLETAQKSWPAWKASHDDYTSVIKSLTDSLLSMFNNYDPFVILSGHSGGGRFIFSFIDAYEIIPPLVKRICFLDSDYGYETPYSKKLITWLNSSPENYLVVLAYNDSNVVLNGKNIVSPTGGTWYRSKMMVNDLSGYYKINLNESDEFLEYSSADKRVRIILKKNPGNEILHTIQVEKNGFIHTILTGTEQENKGYIYYGERAYDEYIN